jgi:hypothetical protein
MRVPMRLLAGVSVALLLVPQAACSGRGDPDPGGRILAALQSVKEAVPDGATVDFQHDVPAEWDSCDGLPENEGWNNITVSVQFRSDLTPEAILDFADRRLEEAGWVDESEIDSPLGPGLRWTQTLADGTEARASLAPGTRDGATVFWDLTAIAPPHGRRVSVVERVGSGDLRWWLGRRLGRSRRPEPQGFAMPSSFGTVARPLRRPAP